jgi:hypothetical protein
VWQLQEPVWQVSEGLDGLKEASGIVEPIKTKDVAVWQLQELEEQDKMKSTPKVVPGAAPAMAKAGVGGFLAKVVSGGIWSLGRNPQIRAGFLTECIQPDILHEDLGLWMDPGVRIFYHLTVSRHHHLLR